jgi:hypothetical protein
MVLGAWTLTRSSNLLLLPGNEPGRMPPAAGGAGCGGPAVLLLLALAIGATVSTYGNRMSGHLTDRLVIVGGAVVFLALAMMATFGLAAQFRSLIGPRVGNAHAVVLRLVAVLVGGFTALLTTLSVLSIPIGQLILGGALTGVISSASPGSRPCPISSSASCY